MNELFQDSKKCFIIKILDRVEVIFMNQTKENIENQSNFFRILKDMQNWWAEFEHFKINHGYNYIDSETDANTRSMARLWVQLNFKTKDNMDQLISISFFFKCINTKLSQWGFKNIYVSHNTCSVPSSPHIYLQMSKT